MRLNRRQEYESHFSSDLRIPHSDQCAQALQCPPRQQKQNLWTVYQFTQTAARSLDSLTVAHSARPTTQTILLCQSRWEQVFSHLSSCVALTWTLCGVATPRRFVFFLLPYHAKRPVEFQGERWVQDFLIISWVFKCCVDLLPWW